MNPYTPKNASAITYAVIVAFIMNLTCENTSVPAIAGARFVVSDRGDSLSPKYAPERIAPAVGPTGTPRPAAIPISARPMVPIVPHDVPVARDVTEQIRTVATKKIDGDNSLSP